MNDSIIEILKTILNRDLQKLKLEISSYTKEKNLWLVTDQVSNSAGNLCLHLIGNLNTYIGAEFGKTGYVRERDQEFALKNVPVSKLLSMIDETILVVENSLNLLTRDDLQKEYPRMLLDKKPSTALFLVHLTTHLTYHLGQINYHRRLLDV
ncbi:DUF1572 family protein [Aquimarina sp. RZ0]|uniref:DUF1572 family protein n=1 Tax=Aquimarina sp. RZ0 TaxID=2607730 RepID=UPI0011F1AB29|nr:DUF1572 family protein [Aquimarina sp. RZ0]KAA1246799.1 DUF1572 domain-containing protein [Aquimarina sp. RZ0]